MTVVLKSPRWTTKDHNFLREYYNEKVRVCPAILADKLGKSVKMTINRLHDLGLRKSRSFETQGKRYER